MASKSKEKEPVNQEYNQPEIENNEAGAEESIKPTEEKKRTRLIGRKDKSKEKIESLESEVKELKDKNLRLFAEFDNFRKRTMREKLDFAKVAGQEILIDLLPVLDDLDRAIKSIETSKEKSAGSDGLQLILQKLNQTLGSKGLKPMEALGQPFDPEMHEAITEVPAADKTQKGKIVDEIEKGYYLNDKIIRYAKVVVGK